MNFFGITAFLIVFDVVISGNVQASFHIDRTVSFYTPTSSFKEQRLLCIHQGIKS